jgi:tetratricopeptide (TPR) repeat protein
MPTINKRFLLTLVLAVAAFAGLLAGAHTIQASRIPGALKRQSDRAAEAGKPDAAISYLRQYLEFVPDDADALERLAELLHARSKNNPSTRTWGELVLLYDRVLRIDPERHAVRRDALALCLKLGRYSDALTHAEALIKAFPAEAALWQQLGAAQTGLNQLAEARKSYERAITYAPKEMLGYQRLAQLVWKNLSDAAGAKAVLDQMIAALPQEPEAYLIRARFESYLAEEAARGGTAKGNVELALKDLRRVLELDPEHAEAALLLAEILQKGRNVPAAHAIYRDTVAIYPRDLKAIRALAWIELVRGNAPAAIAVLEDGLKNTGDGFDLLISLADLLVQQGDTTRTEEILKRLEGRKAPPVQVKYLKARLAMRQAKWGDAVALLEALRAETTSLTGLQAQLNMLLAACFGKLADPAAEEKAYRRVVDADPGHVPARVGLATLHLNLGRFDEAGREAEAAAASPYATGAVHAQAIRLKARRLRTSGGTADDWRKLEAAVAAAAARFGPASSEPVILHAEVLAAGGRLAEAIKVLRKETARRPGDTRLWVVLAEMTTDFAGTAAGLTVVDEAQAVAGDGTDVRLVRANLYAREPGRVRPIDPLAERTESWAETDQLRLLYGLVEVYDGLGDTANVIRMLKRIAVRRPTDLAIWCRLHERATAAGDARTAAEARAAVARTDGENGPSAVVCEAAAASGRDMARAAERLATAFGASPNRADACLALARLKAGLGDPAEAARLTERAFALEPTGYESSRAWAALLCRTGADERAAMLFARLAADYRWAGDPFRRVVAAVLKEVPPPVGVKVIGWCRPLVERDPGGLGWVASCYAALGVAGDTEAALLAALRGQTANADDWSRLVVHRAAAGRKDSMAAALDAARARLTPPAFFALAAAVQETPGGKDWAPKLTGPAENRAFAQARLAVKLSRSDPTAATKVLESFLADKDTAGADAAWAKRNLAMLYAVGGKPADRQRAMELLADVTDNGTTAEELRATASVLTTLSRYLEGKDRAEVLGRAVAALLAAHQKSESPKDLYNLSQLYRVAGDRKASRDCLQRLLNADSKNIYYLLSALEEVTEDRDFKTAETFAAHLLAHHPGEFRAVAAVARFECKAGRPDRALALAEKYTAGADVAAGDYLARSGRVAELLDELARFPNVKGTPTGRRMTDAAVERYAALVPSRPEALIAIAGVLSADGRAAEGFARIEQSARYLTVRGRALSGLAVVRSGASPTQLDTVEKWLKACLDEDPESIPMKLNNAEFLSLRQDLKGATAVYEEVLKKDPGNVVALNNLAWILAAEAPTADRARELVARATREVGLTGDLLDTRARVEITLKQFEQAERDSREAIRQEPTPLRWFHLAVTMHSQSPPRKDEAAKAFAEARARGLDPKGIHPADLPVYKVLDAETNRQPQQP